MFIQVKHIMPPISILLLLSGSVLVVVRLVCTNLLLAWFVLLHKIPGLK